MNDRRTLFWIRRMSLILNGLTASSFANMESAVGKRFAFAGLLILILTSKSSGRRTFRDRTGDLTAFPHDIPVDVVAIRISRSRIPVIDYIEPFPLLERFIFSENELTAFPDLSNVSSTLTTLRLSENQLTVIPSLSPMPALEWLDLRRNLLTRFPDLSNAGSRLRILDLSTNRIGKVENLSPLVALKTLNLDHNRLTEFPDLSNVSATLEELNLVENSFSEIDSMGALPKLRLLTVGGIQFREFPDLADVSSSLEEVRLKKSVVNSVTNLRKMSKLRTLVLYQNRLTALPDLSNLSTTLISLDAAYNRIARIAEFPEMHCLEEISLGHNLLDEFPDFSNTGATLRRLRLDSNEISYVPQSRVVSLKSLNYLDLSHNPILSLPGFCHLNTTVEVLLSECSLTCGWMMAYVKVMESRGNVVFSGTKPHCTTPSALANKDWDDITVEELLDEPGIVPGGSGVKEFQFRRLPTTDWGCPLQIDTTMHNVSAARCGVICGQRPNCLMYSVDGGSCVLTNHQTSSPEMFYKYHKWYVRALV